MSRFQLKNSWDEKKVLMEGEMWMNRHVRLTCLCRPRRGVSKNESRFESTDYLQGSPQRWCTDRRSWHEWRATSLLRRGICSFADGGEPREGRQSPLLRHKLKPAIGLDLLALPADSTSASIQFPSRCWTKHHARNARDTRCPKMTTSQMARSKKLPPIWRRPSCRVQTAH